MDACYCFCVCTLNRKYHILSVNVTKHFYSTSKTTRPRGQAVMRPRPGPVFWASRPRPGRGLNIAGSVCRSSTVAGSTSRCGHHEGSGGQAQSPCSSVSVSLSVTHSISLPCTCQSLEAFMKIVGRSECSRLYDGPLGAWPSAVPDQRLAPSTDAGNQ